jgi:hypothetical protein
MPTNLLKVYPALLELLHLSERNRQISLYGVFKRDIEDNESFTFREKMIRPIKNQDGSPAMQTLFHHLTTRIEDSTEGKETKKRVFELDRSQRLHWIAFHVEEKAPMNIEVFSYLDRTDGKDRKRTYIYDKKEKYVIILELQDTGRDYYLITAYYLNEPRGIKQITKKLKNRLPHIF